MDTLARLRQFLGKCFALDLRSLALYRMGLGLVILCDLALRSRDLVAFYSDQGILPRQILAGSFANPWHWSLHFINGSPVFQAMMFLLAAAFGAMMMVGYRTQLATFVSWVLLVSLNARNPLILNAGDTYLGILTFWGIFLPLGRVWSIDNKRNAFVGESQQTTTDLSTGSLATFALYLQIAMMYVGTGMMKRSYDAWQTGDAIRLSLSKDFIVTRLGQKLVEYPDFLHSLSQVTLYLELLGPLVLLLSRGWLRVGVVAVFVAFHLALAACFTIGLFPWVCIVVFAAFLPPRFWDRLIKQDRVQFQPTEKEENRPRHQLAYYCKQCVLLVALTVAVWTSINSVYPSVAVPHGVRNLGMAFRWSQKWQMFVDLAAGKNGWFVFHAQFVDGTSEDLLTGLSPVSYDKPDLVSATFDNFRWRKLLMNLRKPKYELVRTYLGEYLLLQRDKVHGDVHQLLGLELSFLSPAEVAAEKTADSAEIAALGKRFPTVIPLEKEVLYEWQNEARKYHDVFIRE